MKLGTREAVGMSLAAVVVIALTAAPASALERREVQRIVVEEAVRNGAVPPSLALAVARVESNFDSTARSSAGARGVMQIMPATARSEFGVSASELWNARTNARLGIRYLEQLYKQYGYRWEHALSHYNGGTLKRNRRGRQVPHSYTRRYVSRVMRANRRYERNARIGLLVARSEARVARKASAEASREMPAEWTFDEHGVERDWRSFLEEADEWLGRAKERREARQDERREVRQSSGWRSLDEEAAYWDTESESWNEPDAQATAGERPSDELLRRIARSRERFRRHLYGEGEVWRSLDTFGEVTGEATKGEEAGDEPVERSRFM